MAKLSRGMLAEGIVARLGLIQEVKEKLEAQEEADKTSCELIYAAAPEGLADWLVNQRVLETLLKQLYFTYSWEEADSDFQTLRTELEELRQAWDGVVSVGYYGSDGETHLNMSLVMS